MYEMVPALNSETDPEALLESSLGMAMNAVDAERGMILLSGPSGADFSVRLAKHLEKETEADVETFSRRIVAQAGLGSGARPLAGRTTGSRFQGVSLFRIRSDVRPLRPRRITERWPRRQA